ncbi:hypothetical protein NQ317_014824 [Molorchus minor]|uniref:Uncharacterized protein n=1 Tax=Molorchus minor TaxID=1323400 RepID=A0ABQ9ITD3_9CUCU|nr:hypothetical protein NQ317_014824 [Molorchus minor]
MACAPHAIFKTNRKIFVCSEITIRCIELFVRHTALLRPISQGGRLRLRTDYVHLENTLKTICPQLADLGRPYRLLKSMASLIVLSPTEIVAGQVSVWLDTHTSEAERLDLIAEALQRYENVVRQKNSVNYDPVYPVMSQFLENAVKELDG